MIQETTPYDELVKRDPELEPVLAATGRPDPFDWHDGDRTQGDFFASMVLHISSQQISTLVAFRLYDRLAAEMGGERARRWAPFRTYAAAAFWHSL